MTRSANDKNNANFWFLNVLSGRRALESGLKVADSEIKFTGGVYFAENVPEQHSIALYHEFQKKE